MELLIPGLILVALMVYASTRIKKSAAKAFEAERVETDEFVIDKPEGFLNVIGSDPKYAFEAYSKNFGGDGAEDVRQGTATVTIYDKMGDDRTVAYLPISGDTTLSDISEVIGETSYRVMETSSSSKGAAARLFYKIAEKNGKLYRLEIVALAETAPEFMRDIEAMLASFELK